MAGLIGIALMCAVGCDRACEDYCGEVTAAIEDLGCLTEWGVTWEDQNYADSDAYLEHCQAHFDARIQDAGAASPEDADAIVEECADLLEAVTGAEDCTSIAIADF